MHTPMSLVCKHRLYRNVTLAISALFGFALANVSRADELLVSGYFSDAVARFDASNGSHVANMTDGGVNGPQAVRLGPDGFLYVANEENDNILRFDAVTKEFLTEFVSSGAGGLDGPTALDFGPDGNLYVASFNTDSILRFNGLTGAYIDDFVSSGAGGLNGPDVGMVFGPDGNLYVPSFYNDLVIRYNQVTAAPTNIVGLITPGDLDGPRTILFRGGLMYVASDNNHKVNRYQMDGTFVDTFIASGSGGLFGASGMAFDDDGVLYVSSWRNDRVLRYDTNGDPLGDYFPAGTGGIDAPTFLMFVADPVIPAASTWGLIALALCVVSAGTITLARRSVHARGRC